MQGSIRQRSVGSFELRVFTGTYSATGRRCYRSKTVRGNWAEAERELAAMVEIAGRGLGIAARTTVGELLEQWFTIASTSWSPTTVRQTRLVSPPHSISTPTSRPPATGSQRLPSATPSTPANREQRFERPAMSRPSHPFG
jgi:hypothetical protein